VFGNRRKGDSMTKSTFIGNPNFSKVKTAGSFGRAKWRCNATFSFYNAKTGRLTTVREGYETDFGSVPRLPLMYWLTGDTVHESSAVHDVLCDQHNEDCSITWKEAADEFLEAMVVEGIPAWRRNVMYWAVLARGGNRKCNESDESDWN